MARALSPKRFDKDGVPINQDDWTLEDWRDLWAGIRRIKNRIAKRHRVTPTQAPSVEPKGPKSADASSNPKTDSGEQGGQA